MLEKYIGAKSSKEYTGRRPTEWSLRIKGSSWVIEREKDVIDEQVMFEQSSEFA